ncbi:Pyruvate dehydrogenase E1 beta subunit, partial [Operophtera brumata]
RTEISPLRTPVFSPRGILVEIGEKAIVGKIQQDPIRYVPIVNPRSILPLLENEWQRQEVGLPSQKNEEIQAARLIVIRKRKMKKHQRRKLWKKMRHRWARVKQRRRLTKEKIFQSELLAMVKAANEFSAEDYVRGKLEKANHTPLPTRWRHKRLPEFIIRQLLGIDKKINYKHTDKYKA